MIRVLSGLRRICFVVANIASQLHHEWQTIMRCEYLIVAFWLRYHGPHCVWNLFHAACLVLNIIVVLPDSRVGHTERALTQV